MKPILPILAALILAACNPPEARQVEAAAPAATPAAAPDAPADDCDRVATVFDDLVKRKASGTTEADALADLSARGDYALGYVVDGVFGDRFGPGGSAPARVDTLAACRRMAKGGTLY